MIYKFRNIEIAVSINGEVEVEEGSESPNLAEKVSEVVNAMMPVFDRIFTASEQPADEQEKAPNGTETEENQ